MRKKFLCSAVAAAALSAAAALPEYFTVRQSDDTAVSFSISGIDKVTFGADASGSLGIYPKTGSEPTEFSYQSLGSMTFGAELIGEDGDKSAIDEVTAEASGIVLRYDSQSQIISVSASEGIDAITVYGINGRLIKSLRPEAESARVDVSDLTSGVYAVRVATDSESKTMKIVKR